MGYLVIALLQIPRGNVPVKEFWKSINMTKTWWCTFLTRSVYCLRRPTQPTLYSLLLKFRVDSDFVVPLTRLRTIGDWAFPVAAAKAWNSLPAEVMSAQSLQSFKSKLKTPFFCLILVIFLLGLLLYCKVTEVRCICHFNCMYVCVYCCWCRLVLGVVTMTTVMIRQVMMMVIMTTAMMMMMMTMILTTTASCILCMLSNCSVYVCLSLGQ